MEIFTESSRNELFYASAVLGGRDSHYTTKAKKGGELNCFNKVNAYEKIFNLTCRVLPEQKTREYDAIISENEVLRGLHFQALGI